MNRRARTAPLSGEVTDLFLGLGGVLKRLRRRPLPDAAGFEAKLQGKAPAPRHIVALVQIGLEGRLSMTELAERLSVSLATASQVVTELADWGLLQRTTDDIDRRRTLVAVAPEHEDTIRALLESRLRPLERTLHRLEPDERAALQRGLAVLAEELDKTEETAR